MKIQNIQQYINNITNSIWVAKIIIGTVLIYTIQNLLIQDNECNNAILFSTFTETANSGNGFVTKNPEDYKSGPLDQFIIRDLLILIVGPIAFIITAMSAYLSMSAATVAGLSLMVNNSNRIFASYWSIVMEAIIATIQNIAVSQIDFIKGQKYYCLIYVLFAYIIVSNLIGMIPYNLSTTSHFMVTFFLSFSLVIGATVLGLWTLKLSFFNIFVPAGCPGALIPLLAFIETISYLARCVSLGLRLAANTLSGHMLLSIIGGFALTMLSSGLFTKVLGLVTTTFVSGFYGLEIGIAFIQSQVFCVLSGGYIKDGVFAH